MSNKIQKEWYKKAKRIIKLGGDSIEQRSEVINQRKELGLQCSQVNGYNDRK